MSKSQKELIRTFLSQESALKAFLSRFVYRPHDIEDIAQETFLQVLKAKNSHKIQYPKAYIYRVARNLAMRELTRKSTKLTSFIEDMSDMKLMASSEDVEQNVIVSRRFERVKTAIAELPPQCRRVFIMRKVYGYSQKEISQALKISVSTVEKHLGLGIKRCLASVEAQEEPESNVTHLISKIGKEE